MLHIYYNSIIKVIYNLVWMYEMNTEKETLYDIFLTYSYRDLKELFKKAKTREEQDFYMSLANIVLQREQRRIIGN